MQIRWNRRQWLGMSFGVAVPSALQAWSADSKRTFKIGACDWSLQRRHELSALEVAKEIGLDGVQVSFGEPGIPYDLRKAEVRRRYQEAASRLQVEVASLAMGVLNEKPYASDPESEKWVSDCIEVMAQMKQKIVLVAFFGKGDIKNKPNEQKAVIQRLKKAAPLAEKAGVILAIESWMNSEEHLRILDAVASPAVQVYYDVCNMTVQGYDIFRDMRRLGREHICEIHIKENGFLLGQGTINLKKVKETLDDLGWNGWLIIEGAMLKGKTVVDCYRQNLSYLRTLFPSTGSRG
jgi:L-ribulose-5-phosphate 3-epimerase